MSKWSTSKCPLLHSMAGGDAMKVISSIEFMVCQAILNGSAQVRDWKSEWSSSLHEFTIITKYIYSPVNPRQETIETGRMWETVVSVSLSSATRKVGAVEGQKEKGKQRLGWIRTEGFICNFSLERMLREQKSAASIAALSGEWPVRGLHEW